jgi:hypothetical protein
MIPLYMTVMLTEWKQIVKQGRKKKKPLVFLAVIQKTRILKCLSFGLVWLIHSELVRFFRSELVRFFRSESVRFFGLDRLFLSDWIYQKYSSQALPESEGTLDFIVSLRIVGLQNILINH